LLDQLDGVKDSDDVNDTLYNCI